MAIKNTELLKDASLRLEDPTPLVEKQGHTVYWLGVTEETAFRCNTYLVADHDEYILIDPSNRAYFNQVKARVEQIVDPTCVSSMVLCHEDPDVAASMVDWIEVDPDIQVFTTPRTHLLLPHYGRADYRYYNVSEKPSLPLPSGGELRFIEAPFLHFPGAFTTYDNVSRFLFSGDIWAALNLDWSLTVQDFNYHIQKMNLFHLDYMASNIAARGFIRRLSGVPIDAILPQHGSIIGPEFVAAALDYLENIQCGTDIIYSDLD